MNKKILLVLMLLVNQLVVFGQCSWKLNTEKEGIKVYTSQVPDSKIKAIKVECEIEASPSQLVALLMDVNNSAGWVYHTKSCTMIKLVSPSELYYYSEVNLPWPAENRDFVAHLTVSQNQETKIITIDGPAVTGMVPVKKGVVRIGHSMGKWTITPYGHELVKVEYTLHTDPGGSLPAWIVNMFAAEGPLQVFKAIKIQVQKPVYKNAILPYIDNSDGRLYTGL